MKKFTAALISIVLLLTLASCGNSTDEPHDHDHGAEGTTVADISHTHDPSGASVNYVSKLDAGIREYFNSDEDKQYHELFFDDKTSEYENKSFTKYGTFASIYDAYNSKERYYVWGYGSKAKDCCFQWEFVLPEGEAVPAEGSYIKVTGKMTHSEDALDKYWLTDVTLSVEEAKEETSFDIDFTVLSPTLMRVQAINMLQKKDAFQNKSVRIYGKAVNEVTVAPIDGTESWSFHFSATKDHLNTGSAVIIEGIYNETGTDTLIKASAVTAQS